MKNKYWLSAMFITQVVFATSALASGSLPSSSPAPQRAAMQDKTEDYERGKQIYMSKLACDSCPVKEGVSDMQSAKALVMRIDAKEFGLKSAERRKVKAYLKNRYSF